MGTWKLLGAGIAIMLAATGYAWHSGIISVSSVSGKTAAAANAQAIRPVPVTTSVVQESEFPISHTGMGTVQAYNTVTVKVRVDGEIQKIAFQEGQAVEIGDLLAVIDPRPYQALLQQAEADKARDDALLANARLDLERYSSLVIKEFATHQSVDNGAPEEIRTPDP